MIHLEYLSAIAVSGDDAESFLQSQLTADISSIEPNTANFAAYCTPKGKVLGLLLVCNAGEKYFLVGSSQLLGSITQRLRIFVMRARVTFDGDDVLSVFGVEPADETLDSADCFSVPDQPLRYAIGEQAASRPGQESWKSREIRHGIAWLDELTTEKFIPQMLGQESIGALSFSKGCYPGQEIVARARYLGKVKRKPVVLTLEYDESPSNGSSVELIYADQSVKGVLVESAPVDSNTMNWMVITNPIDGETPLEVVDAERRFRVVN